MAVKDPIKRKQLYDFLKQNDLVETDFDTFSNKYADGDTDQLYSFLQDNNLTTKSQEDFDADYFGDLKKKEDSEPIATKQESDSATQEVVQKSGSSDGQELKPNIPVSVISKRNAITREIDALNKSYEDENNSTDESYNIYIDKYKHLKKQWDDQPRQGKALDFIKNVENKEAEAEKTPESIRHVVRDNTQLEGYQKATPKSLLLKCEPKPLMVAKIGFHSLLYFLKTQKELQQTLTIGKK